MPGRNYRFLILLFIWLSGFGTIQLQAQVPIILTDSLEQKGIRQQSLAIFEDQKKLYSVEQVSSSAFADSFQYSFQKLPVNNNRTSAYWLRFTLVNHSSPEKKWLLEIFDHNINFLAFYMPDKKGDYMILHSGNMAPFHARTFAHKNFEFDLPLSHGDTATYYLRIESENKNVIMPEVRSYKKFITYALGEYHVLGIFYGILLMIAVYNLLLFGTIRKRSYLYYVLYVLGFALYSMCQNGFSFQYLWPENPGYNRYAMGLALYCTILFSLLFTKSFLNLYERLPGINKIINIIIIVRTFILLAGLFYERAILDLLVIDVIILSVAFLSGIISYKFGDRASRYFISAYSILFTSFLVAALENYGWLPSGIVTVYSVNIGIILEIILLSMSLAARMRTEIDMREEAQMKVLKEMKEKELLKDKVNKELEQKVAERTEQLRGAMEKLEKQALEITRMNMILDLANRELKNDVNEIARTRIMKSHVDFDEFIKVYPDELSCYRFLEELKKEHGFVCKKCESVTAGKGKEVFDRRCNRCGYNESITANTIFHKLKFPIVKAFYILYLVNTRKDITAEELSGILGLRKTTCAVFKKKISDRLTKRGKKEMQGWDTLILDKAPETIG